MLLSDVTSIEDLYDFFRQDERVVIGALQEEGFLRPLKTCAKKTCRTREVLYRNVDYKGNYAAYCKKCKKFRSLTNGTFFEGTHLSFKHIFVSLWFWVCHVSSRDCANVTGIAREACVQYFRFFR